MSENFLQETVQCIVKNGHTTDEVLWVGSDDGEYAISWADFVKIADFEYDPDNHRGLEVVADLVVVGDGWWMERDQYDGTEWWSFKTIPLVSNHPQPFNLININAVHRNAGTISALLKAREEENKFLGKRVRLVDGRTGTVVSVFSMSMKVQIKGDGIYGFLKEDIQLIDESEDKIGGE